MQPAECCRQPNNRKRKALHYRLLNIILVVLVLASCKKGQKNLFTPTSSGRPYEVLVVVNKAVWDRPAGRALFDVLDTNVPGLPQAERSFRISNIAPEHFDPLTNRNLQTLWQRTVR